MRDMVIDSPNGSSLRIGNSVRRDPRPGSVFGPNPRKAGFYVGIPLENIHVGVTSPRKRRAASLTPLHSQHLAARREYDRIGRGVFIF